ncbi:hypothetical protein DRH14_03335 [Candidatus Shapirobacteria bacterium]|nr:MAG: hypothetical protein DRH14_03335 [Candidatus Shapirobacteria bacterium]
MEKKFPRREFMIGATNLAAALVLDRKGITTKIAHALSDTEPDIPQPETIPLAKIPHRAIIQNGSVDPSIIGNRMWSLYCLYAQQAMLPSQWKEKPMTGKAWKIPPTTEIQSNLPDLNLYGSPEFQQLILEPEKSDLITQTRAHLFDRWTQIQEQPNLNNINRIGQQPSFYRVDMGPNKPPKYYYRPILEMHPFVRESLKGQKGQEPLLQILDDMNYLLNQFGLADPHSTFGQKDNPDRYLTIHPLLKQLRRGLVIQPFNALVSITPDNKPLITTVGGEKIKYGCIPRQNEKEQNAYWGIAPPAFFFLNNIVLLTTPTSITLQTNAKRTAEIKIKMRYFRSPMIQVTEEKVIKYLQKPYTGQWSSGVQVETRDFRETPISQVIRWQQERVQPSTPIDFTKPKKLRRFFRPENSGLGISVLNIFSPTYG